MNLQQQTLQQKVALVALRPEMERRYKRLKGLLEACTESEIEPELWQIELARADLDAVLNTMLPRIIDPEDED